MRLRLGGDIVAMRIVSVLILDAMRMKLDWTFGATICVFDWTGVFGAMRTAGYPIEERPGPEHSGLERGVIGISRLY